MQNLAVICTHPIQYYAPWFQFIAAEQSFNLKVFYLWDFGVTRQMDTEFEKPIRWDVPLLKGYCYEFVSNHSSTPGTDGFWGLQNPTLVSVVRAFSPDAVLMMAYNYASLYRFMWQWKSSWAPLLFRGDSHRLLPAAGLKEGLRQRWITRIFSKFSAFLYVGKANFEYFSRHGAVPKQLFFSPHSVDNQRFLSQSEEAKRQAQHWKVKLNIPLEHKVILFAGKFTTQKCPLDLLNAFLVAKLQNVSLLFVGTGPLEVALKRRASGYSAVKFAPFQNQTYMPRTYAIADLFVLPSYSETWGLAVNEAMCLGCPVVVSCYVGCAQDLVEQNENGLVFPAGDVEALSEALQYALADDARLKAWGDRSREIITNYSYRQATDGLMQALAYLEQFR